MSAAVFVYMFAKSADGIPCAPVKVGISSNPAERLATIQTSSPIPLVVVATFLCPTREAARTVEAAFHGSQARNRTSGEWFNMQPIKAMQLLCISMKYAIDYNIDDAAHREIAYVESGLQDNCAALDAWLSGSFQNDNQRLPT